MIPISDENPTRLKPFVTWAIIFACVVTFLWQLMFSEGDGEALFFSLGFVPRNLFDSAVTETVYGIPWPWLTLITSMFLHGGFLHLGGNMLYLWIFGNNVEDAMGTPLRELIDRHAGGVRGGHEAGEFHGRDQGNGKRHDGKGPRCGAPGGRYTRLETALAGSGPARLRVSAAKDRRIRRRLLLAWLPAPLQGPRVQRAVLAG